MSALATPWPGLHSLADYPSKNDGVKIVREIIKQILVGSQTDCKIAGKGVRIVCKIVKQILVVAKQNELFFEGSLDRGDTAGR
eukprot:scaffold3515_cov126-Cylindrotheca_fusiformis.AAC.47